ATVAIERATAAKDADNVRIDIMFCSRNSAMPRSRGAAALARRAEVLDFQEGSSQRGADGRIGTRAQQGTNSHSTTLHSRPCLKIEPNQSILVPSFQNFAIRLPQCDRRF